MWTGNLKEFVAREIAQKREEGCDVADFERRLSATEEERRTELEKILEDLGEISPKPDFPYKEPSSLREIEAERPEKPYKIQMRLSESELYDKIYGGWLGRCAGCLLGKPVEGLEKEKIEKWLKIASAYPLDNYFPPIHNLPEDPPDWLVRQLSRKEGMLLGQFDRMARDDDIDYTILNLHILQSCGPDFSPMDVGETWLRLLPYWQVFTAERVAYRNLVNGLVPPETATHANPYREFIGAQIRADAWGYATPGTPELAAEFAYRDASLSHVKNGIYGEMLLAAMISAAFTTDNIEELINIGLSMIPRKSRLAEAVKDVVCWSKTYSNWKDTWEKIREKYGHYSNGHTINNAALVLLGLLYAEGDYEKGITISVMGGWDTDCNGATTGSILGVISGAENLPEKWIRPLNDRTESFVIGHNNSKISAFAQRTLTIARNLL